MSVVDQAVQIAIGTLNQQGRGVRALRCFLEDFVLPSRTNLKNPALEAAENSIERAVRTLGQDGGSVILGEGVNSGIHAARSQTENAFPDFGLEGGPDSIQIAVGAGDEQDALTRGEVEVVELAPDAFGRELKHKLRADAIEIAVSAENNGKSQIGTAGERTEAVQNLLGSAGCEAIEDTVVIGPA